MLPDSSVGIGGTDVGIGGSDVGTGGSDVGIGGSDVGTGGSDVGIGGSDVGTGGTGVVTPVDPSQYLSPFDLAYSPDGSQLAVSDSTNGALHVVQPAAGTVSCSAGLSGYGKGVAWIDNSTVWVSEYDLGAALSR